MWFSAILVQYSKIEYEYLFVCFHEFPQFSLKGQCHEIFGIFSFHESKLNKQAKMVLLKSLFSRNSEQANTAQS